MFRGTGAVGVILAVVFGLIVADLITHPTGTKTISNGIISLEKNTGNQLLGNKA